MDGYLATYTERSGAKGEPGGPCPINSTIIPLIYQSTLTSFPYGHGFMTF